MRALSTVFAPVVIEQIVSIPLPLFPVDDNVFWPGSKDGYYSAKSGYVFVRDHESRRAASSSTSHVVPFEFWQRLWKIEAQPRVKELFWRLCRGVVPVRSKLSSRGMEIDACCPFCNTEPETLFHAFFGCCHVAPYWFASSLSFRMDALLPQQPLEFIHVAHQVFEEVDDEALRVLFAGCAALWERRNKFVFQGELLDIAWLLHPCWKLLETDVVKPRRAATGTLQGDSR
ncbi:uncharacterized protein LOC130725435 [Lotus japonicus]|uniref:uncharacterized protein LOC130725435 n=1 Tax=Lotus japonicus TaxID=34305 RepID=UPI0025885EBC|nr:uncharacterized protein LOC130725435 [Lotus japonicus]